MSRTLPARGHRTRGERRYVTARHAGRATRRPGRATPTPIRCRVRPTPRPARGCDDRRHGRFGAVVDDDPVFRGLARRMLAAGGLVVVGEAATVADGHGGGERVAARRRRWSTSGCPTATGSRWRASARRAAVAPAHRPDLDATPTRRAWTTSAASARGPSSPRTSCRTRRSRACWRAGSDGPRRGVRCAPCRRLCASWSARTTC